MHQDNTVQPQYLSPTWWGNQGTDLDHDLDGFLQNVTRSTLQFPQEITPMHPHTSMNLPAMQEPSSERRRRTSHCKFCGKRVSMPCMLSLLPPRETCEQLRAHFIATVYPLIPILPLPLFNKHWEDFWSEYQGGQGHGIPPGPTVRRTPASICIMFSMLFASTASSCTGKAEEVSRKETFLSATITTLSLTGFPRRATPASLAAYLFMQSLVIKEEEFLDAPAFLSHAYRIALGMGLHRDGSSFGLDPGECEFRRKIWWFIIHLDVMAAASSGLPPLHIDDRISDTQMISAMPDSDPVSTPTIAENERQVDVRHIVAIARFTITKTIRQLLSRRLAGLQYAKYLPGAQKSFENLCQFMGKTIAQLLQANSYQTSEEEEAQQASTAMPWTLTSNERRVKAFRSYSAQLLHLMLHKTAIVMYQPLFQYRQSSPNSSPQPSNQMSRSEAVRHCHEFLRLFLRLCMEPDFEHFHWMYPGTYQPLQPVSILLADLIEAPAPGVEAGSSSAAPSKRLREISRGLIDQILTLYQMDHGIVDRYQYSVPGSTQQIATPARVISPRRNLSIVGREAWEFLLRTRERVCRRAGEDPHVLWPGDSLRDRTETRCVCGLGLDMLGVQSQTTAMDFEQAGPSAGGSASVPLTLSRVASSESVGEEGDEDAIGEPDDDDDEGGDTAAAGTEGFDWAEWDAVLGSATSVFPWEEG